MRLRWTNASDTYIHNQYISCVPLRLLKIVIIVIMSHSSPSSPRRYSVSSLSSSSSHRRTRSCKHSSASSEYSTTSSKKTSHLALLASRRSSSGNTPPNTPSTVSLRRSSNFLEVPDSASVCRTRVNSLPGGQPYNPRDVSKSEEEFLYTLRKFNITSRGNVVNCGDTIVQRSKSNNCISSFANTPVCSTRRGSLSPRLLVQSSEDEEDDEVDVTYTNFTFNPKYRVVLLGETGVGKSAIVRQFMTSEYINTYDMSLDEEYGEREVSVQLDSTESQLVFIDHPFIEMSVENSLSTYEPHACVVVYSVTDKRSFEFAAEALRYLWQEGTTHDKCVILVGNKSDLARARVISTQDGKNLATNHDCKFIETSSGIQHNIDELLVGVLKQIRLREEANVKRLRSNSPTNMFSLLFTHELINKLCFITNKAKSCENLHVL